MGNIPVKISLNLHQLFRRRCPLKKKVMDGGTQV